MNQHAKQNASYTAIAAILMLVSGWWWFAGREATASAGPLYAATVKAFVWTLRIGGVGMTVVALLCFMGASAGLLLDALVSGISGVILFLCGLYWLIDDGFMLPHFIVAFFGVMFVRAAWASWTLLGQSDAAEAESKPPPAPEPIHPASVHPNSLPKDGEPPPPDGYLAALADEKQEPPTASYE